MSRPYISVGRLVRQFSTGKEEDLHFSPGVNLLVGRPNTGKTKWLQTLDYLLGEAGENPFDGADDAGLAGKYKGAGVELRIGDETFWVERRWQESGVKTRIAVDGKGMTTRDFQGFLMERLGIPLLHFPRGNPMSGQTWPELSFRMLLRHVYRQQRFWGRIVDQQPEGEQHACLLLFLGLAEHVFNEDYGNLVRLKMEVEQLKARRAQYDQTLDALASDLVSIPGLTVGVSATTIRAAEDRLGVEVQELRQYREALIGGARDHAIPPELQEPLQKLSEERARCVVGLEGLRQKAEANAARLDELRRYRKDLGDELERMSRVEDAGAELSNLKITHCPACDQTVPGTTDDPRLCFLCHQPLPEGPLIEGLASVRLQFERERLQGEQSEAEDLVRFLQRDSSRVAVEIAEVEERLRVLDNELTPARNAVAALVQGDVSAIDMELGKLHERQGQLRRVTGAVELGQELTERIAEIERQIEPLEERVNETVRSTDFEAAASELEEGMNNYLNEINSLRPGVWRHNPVSADLSRSNSTFRVGTRRWHEALGGTDTLYFLMAYQYGLLALSDKARRHYPGLSIIDLPAEFSGELIEDKENFIVQPFIGLLAKDDYDGAQLIITGASFAGLVGPSRLSLTHVYVA